ncbi:hypothetical protein LOTGIDRAFT_160869 [Lottia gigantea]|uniref:c-SKI SMAD4-binding domain-containing protein n=1 Tax=Lottia gigantea TaxID=225164 RepID=V4AE08_LOTGI|nr:hypothetical protein LOTGIDRAFT_160869 [Lottia gigantea]ESO95107.1 hypothetical protein LOTGIDRAFT_160869 [Lottia gigantea]
MDFNALDLLASAAVLQTRDSDTTGGTECTAQGSGSGSSESTEQGADNDEDPNSSTEACIDLNDTESKMGSMKKGKHPQVTSVGDFPKQVISSDMDELINEKVNEKTINEDVTVDIVKSDLVECTDVKSLSEKVDNSDTDSCVEEDIEEHIEVSTSTLVELSSFDVEDSPGKIKTIMRSLLTGQTVCDDVDDSTNNPDSDNCDEKHEQVSVLGNDSAIGLYVNDKIDTDLKMDKDYSCLNSSKNVGNHSIIDCDKDNITSLHDSALESSQSASDQSSSLGDNESLHFLVVSDHCYATVPGKTSNLRCSFLSDEPESDSGIDGNSSSEEAEHRTRSISLESNCLQCSFPEVSGRSGQLLSQGSSDLERSPIGNSGFPLGGLTVLSPTLSSSDSQCSDYHNNSTTGNLDTVCDATRKPVDFEVDSSLSSTTSDPAPEHNLKVGKFRIGKFASFTNIDTDQEKIYGRDAFSPEYGVSSASTALPSSPGIPSLLQSPCGDWDRSDAGSEALDDLESFLTPEPPKELMMVLQGIKSPTTAISPPAVQSSVVHHDHDYCFRSGTLPPSPVTSKKNIKSEKRKYMTAARSRGTPASLKESKRSKNLKIKNNIKGPLSETIEKVKNSLATTPVPIDCNFKKPEQPVNSLLLDKLNSLNRQKRVKSLEIKEEIVEDGEVEIDAGSKLKITGKFQNDFVYFLNKTSRNRRRSSVDTSLPLETKKSIQPAKPIDIIIPHLTDDDLEVLQTKGRAGLARLEKFSSNPNLLDRFSATLQTPNNKAGTPTVISGDRIKNERNNGVDDDDKIINTILSMENDNLASPVPVDNVQQEIDFFGDGETINLMGENMTLTKDQVDLLLNAVKHVSTPDSFTGNEKVELGSTDCDHSSTCSTEILDPNTSDVANPEWTINNNTPKLDKQDTDTESTYSSSDVGPSSCVSDIKEDSQESFELRSDIVIQEDQGDVLKDDNDVAIQKVYNDQTVNIKTELDIKIEVKDDIVIPNLDGNVKTEAEIKVEKDVSELIKSDLVDIVVNVDSNLVDKSLNRSITNVTDNRIMTVDEIVKPMIIDNELGHIDMVDTKPDKSLLDTELNAFPNSLAPSLSDLSLPLEKSFELLGSDFRLDKPDELFPEAHVESSMPEPTESDYNDTPWVVTVTVFWNDLPAIMINNRPYIRLVDIHKQILPAKDTGILKKRCQLLSIHVVNCTEMQRYFLVQYGRGYNSKSTLIVGKADACQLVGYYAQPQPRLPRSEDGVLNNLSRLSQHMAMIRGKQSRFNKRKRPNSKTASRNTSPERKDGIKNCVVPTSPKPRKQPPPQPVIQPELTKRLRHKKINFLEMLKGDSQDKVEVEETNEKKVAPQPVQKKKESSKKTNNRTPPSNKKKEIEIIVTPGDVSSEEEEESEDLSETETEEEIDDFSEGDGESESDEAEESDTVEEVIISKKKGVKSNGNNMKQSPKKSPRSTNDKSPNNKGKLGPLRVNVQGLLNFSKSVKKSAINDKTGCKSLDVVHIPLEFHDGRIPISQSGKIFLDLYKKKSSLCVKCADCDKLLSISSFLQHQHYPEESKTLTTVLDTQTLSLKSSEMSRNIKQLWEELQKRYEKFEGCRFLKPVVKAVISPLNSEKLSNFKSVIVRENYPQQPHPVVRANIPVPNLNISLECETDIVHVNEKLPQTILDNSEQTNLDNSELTDVEVLENKSETLQLNHCHINKCDVDKKSEFSANDKMLNTEKGNETVMVSLDSDPTSVKLQDTTIQPCKKSGTVKSSGTEVKTASKNNNIQTMDYGLDKSGVRSSSRKRKSRQYFSFEDYSFSNKKTKVDESSECK